MKMEIEPIPVTIKDKIRAGNIVELKVNDEGNRTEEPIYYLIGYSEESDCYYLVNMETGVTFPTALGELFATEEDIQDLIEEYDGKVYDEKESKLTLEIVQS